MGNGRGGGERGEEGESPPTAKEDNRREEAEEDETKALETGVKPPRREAEARRDKGRRTTARWGRANARTKDMSARRLIHVI